ncbi:MAG: hypothetical protein EZS28_022188, partial [Streblomastix strix]
TLNTAQTITGIKSFTQPITANRIIKLVGTSNQILLANGDTTDVGDFLPKYFPHTMGQLIFEPSDKILDQGIRIMKYKANLDSFVLTGCNTDPMNRDGVWKMFNNQIIAPITLPLTENAIKQAFAYEMYEQLEWGSFTAYNGRAYLSVQVTHSDPNTVCYSTYTLFSAVKEEIKPKFTRTPFTVPLNAVLFVQKGICYPILWNGAIPIDCYIDMNVDAVGSGKTTLISKLIIIYKQKIYLFILYFSNFGADETMALNLNSKNIILTNITYEKAMYFLPQFDEIKYSVEKVYTFWKLRELNISYKSDYIQRMKERIIQINPIKENPTRLASASIEKQMKKPKDYPRKIVKIFEQECIDKIIKYSVPTMIMRFTVPAIIYNVYFEMNLSISQDDGDVELKITKIPILFYSSLLNSLLIFDDIGSNADIQRFSSGLAKTITHLVSNSRYSKKTVFFVAQMPSYMFKTARILSHVTLKITTLEQEVNVQQQTLGIDTLDIGENSANGDFAFSAESGTVWMFDQNWYNSGDIVPDQAIPARDANPIIDNRNGVTGTSTEYSHGDHQHPLQVFALLPSKDTSVGTVGQANTYASSDQKHPIQTVKTIPVSVSADGSYGTVESYARNDHYNPISVQTNASIEPITNIVRNNGTSAYYSRHDHVHPQQLTYDGNVTVTKFIKSGGLPTEVLCANGDTTVIDNKLSRTYNGTDDGWIRLCVFPAGASVSSPFIEFKVYLSYNAVQIIRLISYYTVNGISIINGIFTAPTRVNSYYEIDKESTGSITIVVSDQSTYYTNRITEILTQAVLIVVSNGTQIPFTYDLANGGIINNMLQVNPTGCSTTAINTTQVGQWKISKTSDKTLTINTSNLRQADHSVGLMNVGTDQTITGVKTFDTIKKTNGTNQQILLADGSTMPLVFAQ